MKIAFLYGAWSIGTRPLDFNCLRTDSRGLTGSELAVTATAKEMVKRGHEVSLFTVYKGIPPKSWEGIRLYSIDERFTIIDDSFGAIVSYNEPDILRGLPDRPLRVVNQMLNDFSYCQRGFDDQVNIWTSPCEMHCKHLKKQIETPEKWSVLPLGCDPSIYPSNERIPGRVIWMSSCDRGLHNLLQIWPKIKATVPIASLRIFYHFNYDSVINIEPNVDGCHPGILELGHRARYMKEAMKRLKPLDVEQIGSVSCERIEKELSQSMVLGFSADTISMTEGFSLSTLQNCAAGVLPILCDVDCLGSIYGGVVPTVKAPMKDHLEEYAGLVVRGLTDKEYWTENTNKCKEFTQNFLWPDIAKQLENLIKTHPKFKE